ncbi:hypothetical protein RB201_18535 [Streptomyces sp. S1A(2023)]
MTPRDRRIEEEPRIAADNGPRGRTHRGQGPAAEPELAAYLGHLSVKEPRPFDTGRVDTPHRSLVLGPVLAQV